MLALDSDCQPYGHRLFIAVTRTSETGFSRASRQLAQRDGLLIVALDPARQQERSARLAELLSRTALADQTAFAELYRQTSSHLYAVALRILRESAAAEEILQESFVSVWHHAASYVSTRSQPLTWLTSIVRNRCLDKLRRREVDTITMDDGDDTLVIADGTSNPLELLLEGAEARAVRECVDALDGGTKQAIALAFYQGLSHAELARQLQQPLGTVKSWIRRGLEKLKSCLDGSGFGR